MLNQMIEDWIGQNESRGNSSTYRLLRWEDESKVDLYKQTVRGQRYGNFGIHQEAEQFVVTLCHTGGRCGLPFSSGKEARRFIFCITGLYDWKKVQWQDEEPHLPEDLMLVCREANSYCRGEDGEFSALLDKIKSLSSEDEFEDIEAEVVEFGGTPAPSKVQPAGTWGMTVT